MTDVQHQVSRAWQQYTIMHLDRRVASIHSKDACVVYETEMRNAGGNGVIRMGIAFSGKEFIVKHAEK